MNRERFLTTAGAAVLLLAAAFPFVVLFPERPAFGPETVALMAGLVVVATVARAWRADTGARRRTLLWAGALFAATAATTGSGILLHGDIPVPILDVLPGLFGLDGEDAETAILFEVWSELWLFWAVVLGLLVWRVQRRAMPDMPREPRRRERWNAATLLLWAVGWCAMVGTVVQGHRVAAFLDRASHAEGTIADDAAHPLIRFTTADGTVVTFRQNGGISRAPGAAVPVAYEAADPQGTAQADTFFVVWGDVAGLAWVGLGFTLFPFFGWRAAFGRR